MNPYSTIFLLALSLFGCVSGPTTKEEVMEAYLFALAECDTATLNDLMIDEFDYGPYECNTYETEVIKIECKTEGRWTSCCCEEEVKGRAEFNGRIYSRYGLTEIDGKWKVSMMYKESDLGRRHHLNICN